MILTSIIEIIRMLFSTYSQLAGPNGINILQQLYPTGTPMHPVNGRMSPFCPETADVVSDFLRTGRIAPIDQTHYVSRDAFFISSEDVLSLSTRRHRNRYLGNGVGNWQHLPHHSIQAIQEPPQPHWINVPAHAPREPHNPSHRAMERFNVQIEHYNNLVNQRNEQIQEYRTRRLNYYTQTLASPIPNDVDVILDSIKHYIKTTEIGRRYNMGHVVVHGIRDNRINVVNRRDHTQHFFVIMLFRDEIYLVDAMLGFRVNRAQFTNDSTHQVYEGVVEGHATQPVDSRGPIITKNMNIIRSYFRYERFRNIRYTLTYDAVRSGNLHRGVIEHESPLGVPDYGVPVEPTHPDSPFLFF